MFAKAVAVIVASGLIILSSGCSSSAPRIAKTASGNPEVFIPDVTVDEVKSRLIERNLSAGMNLDSDSPSRVVVSRQMEGMQESMMRLAIGNSYSTPVRSEATFTLASINNGVKVFAAMSAWTQMPLGQINRVPLNSDADFNAIQSSLFRLRDSFGGSYQSIPGALNTQERVATSASTVLVDQVPQELYEKQTSASKVVDVLHSQEELKVLAETDGMYKVRTVEGVIGWLGKSKVKSQ